jgi:hypothetical protein
MNGLSAASCATAAPRHTGAGVVFLLLLTAFFKAQVLEVRDYRLQSEKNRLRQVPLLAPRGAIFDRNNAIIAENVPGYTVKLFAPSADSLRAVLGRISALAPLDTADVETILRRFRTAPYQPTLVFTGARFETVSRLEEKRYLLPGLVIQTEPRRIYSAAGAVAHLVGYVGEVNEEDLTKDRYPGSRMGSVVGRDGLEQQYDSVLAASMECATEVDARGRMVREEVSSPSLAPIAGCRSKRRSISAPGIHRQLVKAALPTRGARAGDDARWADLTSLLRRRRSTQRFHRRHRVRLVDPAEYGRAETADQPRAWGTYPPASPSSSPWRSWRRYAAAR